MYCVVFAVLRRFRPVPDVSAAATVFSPFLLPEKWKSPLRERSAWTERRGGWGWAGERSERRSGANGVSERAERASEHVWDQARPARVGQSVVRDLWLCERVKGGE